MSLPPLTRKPGVDFQYVGGRGYDDIAKLFAELHEGVMEIAEGWVIGKSRPPLKLDTRALSVLPSDSPQRTPPRFGFVLNTETTQDYRYWEFDITIEDFNRTKEKLPPHVREVITTVRGRATIAMVMQAGRTIAEMEERFADPAVQYLQGRIKKLDEEVDAARKQAQHEELTKERPKFPQMPGATKQFMLQHKVGALQEFLAELLRGEHLTE